MLQGYRVQLLLVSRFQTWSSSRLAPCLSSILRKYSKINFLKFCDQELLQGNSYSFSSNTNHTYFLSGTYKVYLCFSPLA